MKPVHSVLVGGLLLLGLAAAAAAVEVRPAGGGFMGQDADAGVAVYQTHCAACHQANGEGVPGAFPPLAGNPNAADREYVETVVRSGLSGEIQVLGVTYNAVMPPVALSEADLANVVAYVVELSQGQVEPPATSAAPPATADAGRGESLFIGATSLVNGGPACRGCHSAGDVGFAGGSGLGPDLTNAHSNLGGDAGLAAWLANPASPTMRPLFADKEMTSGEIADLTAFLAATRQQGPSGGFDRLLLAGVIGMLALLGLMAWLIRGPQETYTQRLRRRA